MCRVECKYNEPGKLPKNFAMFKVLQKHARAKIVSDHTSLLT